MLGAAERKLARLGLTPMQMRVAAQRGAELHTPPSARLLPESKPKWRGPGKPKVGAQGYFKRSCRRCRLAEMEARAMGRLDGRALAPQRQ
jgi:hypothetical protein